MNNEVDFEPEFDLEFDELEVEADLSEVCYKIVEYWMEDYSFEELLEEFDVLPEEAFYLIVKSGRIDEDDIRNYLASE